MGCAPQQYRSLVELSAAHLWWHNEFTSRLIPAPSRTPFGTPWWCYTLLSQLVFCCCWSFVHILKRYFQLRQQGTTPSMCSHQFFALNGLDRQQLPAVARQLQRHPYLCPNPWLVIERGAASPDRNGSDISRKWGGGRRITRLTSYRKLVGASASTTCRPCGWEMISNMSACFWESYAEVRIGELNSWFQPSWLSSTQLQGEVDSMPGNKMDFFKKLVVTKRSYNILNLNASQ